MFGIVDTGSCSRLWYFFELFVWLAFFMAHHNGTSGGFTISDILWSIYGSSVLSACLNRASQRRSRAGLMNLLLLCTTCLETICRALSWDFVRVNGFEGLALRTVICSTWEKELEQTLKVHLFHHKHSVSHQNSNAYEKRTIQNEWCIYTCINAKHVNKNGLVGYLHSALELSFVRDVQRWDVFVKSLSNS